MTSQDPVDEFEQERRRNIEALGQDTELQALSLAWNIATARHKYTYNFSSFGRPIIQFPQDIVAVQELIWAVRPDLIIETGIAHGGSLVLSASMLALLDYCDAVAKGNWPESLSSRRRVLGIDIDIRSHNRSAIESHPLAHRIEMIEGSSTAADIVEQVCSIANSHEKILILLDSNHTHDHVLAELEAYAPLTSPGSYCVVFDTIVENFPDGTFPNRPWGKGNNPLTAVREYLRRLREEGREDAQGRPLLFEPDKAIEDKLLITVAPEGYLRRL